MRRINILAELRRLVLSLSVLMLRRCEEVELESPPCQGLLKPPTTTGPQPVILSTGEVSKAAWASSAWIADSEWCLFVSAHPAFRLHPAKPRQLATAWAEIGFSSSGRKSIFKMSKPLFTQNMVEKPVTRRPSGLRWRSRYRRFSNPCWRCGCTGWVFDPLQFSALQGAENLIFCAPQISGRPLSTRSFAGAASWCPHLMDGGSRR